MPGIINFKEWPEDAQEMPRNDIVEMYNRGFMGCFREPEQDEALDDGLQWMTFADAAIEFGLEGSGAGKLSLPYLCAQKHNPQVWPGPAQRTGSCVSRGTINACLVSIFVEVDMGKPDEVTGKVEGAPPEVPYPDQQNFSHEIVYGCRGHRGQGASCSRLTRAVSEWGGLLPRGIYDVPGYGKFDCRRYDDRLAANLGPMTPDALLKFAKEKSYVRTVTRIRSVEEARDALANGYGLNCCSGYGFSGPRNEHGVTQPRGSWSHAMAWIACDDRRWAHETYGGPLFLIQNSWGKYNSGPRRIHGTDIDIPHGSFWVTHRSAAGIIRSGGSFAFSSVHGFPPRELGGLETPEFDFSAI